MSPTTSRVGSPAPTAASPASTCWPAPSHTDTREYAGSSRSLNQSCTRSGGRASVARAGGDERTSTACAQLGAGDSVSTIRSVTVSTRAWRTGDTLYDTAAHVARPPGHEPPRHQRAARLHGRRADAQRGADRAAGAPAAGDGHRAVAHRVLVGGGDPPR